MKMGDGGFRPAFNVQLATATDSQVITGVDVTNSGGDQGQLAPMVEQHRERYATRPRRRIGRRGLREEGRHRPGQPPQGGTAVYAPVMESKDPTAIPTRPATTTARQWPSGGSGWQPTRRRRSTGSGPRPPNVSTRLARNRGLQRFQVRGLRKVKAVVLLYVLAHNLMRAVTAPAAAKAVLRQLRTMKRENDTS